MNQFRNFVNLHFDKNTAEFDYLNGFTTFNMCDSENRKKIHDIRKKWIINNFCNYEPVIQKDYENYYNENILDNYNYNFNPPKSYYTEPNIEKVEYDDIDDHYRYISNNYSRIVLLQSQKKEEELDDIECEYSGYHSDSSYDLYITIDNDSFYESYEEFDDYVDYEDDYDY